MTLPIESRRWFLKVLETYIMNENKPLGDLKLKIIILID